MKKSLLALGLLLSSHLQAAELVVKDGYIRAMPPGSTTTAAFMTLANKSQQTVTLVDIRSEIAMHTMIHDNVVNDGVASMVHVDSLSLKAGESTQLIPGGKHIMLMHLQQVPKLNETVELVLEYADGTTQTIKLPVKKQ